MCGIFGLGIASTAELEAKDYTQALKDLFLLSEQRGKESSGIALGSTRSKVLSVFKSSFPASEFIRENDYDRLTKDEVNAFFDSATSPEDTLFTIAHSRLVTNGTQFDNRNNQPVVREQLALVHNGIVTNVDDLWSLPALQGKRQATVDSEVLLALILEAIKQNKTLEESVATAFSHIEGAASIAILIPGQSPSLALATNTGSLYFAWSATQPLFAFASEHFTLKELKRRRPSLGLHDPEWLPANHWIWVPASLRRSESTFEPIREPSVGFSAGAGLGLQGAWAVRDLSRYENARETHAPAIVVDKSDSLLEYNDSEIRQLRRCSTCILPETFPFIEFDAEGVCNFCHHHKTRPFNHCLGAEAFLDVLKHFRRPNRERECIIALSGGRDSCYGLHVIVKELGLKPITYTYDWGMVTDLARRNIARITGKLGVEHILVSADIRKKRENIRRNVLAWLKSPRLGLVPLFMAGDKQFFRYVNLIKRQTGIALDIWCSNRYENTDFKAGFCGVRPVFLKNRIESLPYGARAKMASYYLWQFLKNPRYLNYSLFDTLGAFYAYYFEPRRHHYLLFDYIPWDEKKIESTLFSEYHWETSPDTPSTWRVGDGTAAFYNYIYFTMAGFSEVDTFLSNQVRDGIVTRHEALEKAMEANHPRAASLRWYFDMVGLPFDDTIRAINKAPKLYRSPVSLELAPQYA